MNPYVGLDDSAFWKKAVANKSLFDLTGLWKPKFKIDPVDKVSTYGSCFAQHIGNGLKSRGFNWFVSETGPVELPLNIRRENGYNIFSSRTGNIYTTNLFLQWIKWSLGIDSIPDEVWEKNGKFIDPFRPTASKKGFESKEELLTSRRVTLCKFKETLVESDIIVFTLGLTERWLNKSGSYEYPMCPGTIAGEFKQSEHCFDNMDFNSVVSALEEAIEIIRELNKQVKFILTVSPVPLTATKSGHHVLQATTASKSILRAVTDYLYSKYDYVDYFPSYEIITGVPFKSVFFNPNLRTVNPAGVDFVMRNFFGALGGIASFNQENKSNDVAMLRTSVEEVCEESLLEAFSDKGRKK